MLSVLLVEEYTMLHILTYYKIRIMKICFKYIYLKPVPLKINTLASSWLILKAPSQTNQNTVSQQWQMTN